MYENVLRRIGFARKRRRGLDKHRLVFSFYFLFLRPCVMVPVNYACGIRRSGRTGANIIMEAACGAYCSPSFSRHNQGHGKKGNKRVSVNHRRLVRTPRKIFASAPKQTFPQLMCSVIKPLQHHPRCHRCSNISVA